MAKTTYQLMREQDIMPSTSELCSRLEPELIWEELKESIGEKLPKIVEQTTLQLPKTVKAQNRKSQFGNFSKGKLLVFDSIVLMPLCSEYSIVKQ